MRLGELGLREKKLIFLAFAQWKAPVDVAERHSRICYPDFPYQGRERLRTKTDSPTDSHKKPTIRYRILWRFF